MLRAAGVVVAILALAAPLAARYPVQTIVSGLAAERRPARHPRTEDHVLRVSRELPADAATLLVQYWRTSSRAPGQGHLSVRVKILRELEGSERPEVVYRNRASRRVWGSHFTWSWIDLPDLLPGDLILTSFRMRGMPRLRRHDAAYAETLLREDQSD